MTLLIYNLLLFFYFLLTFPYYFVRLFTKEKYRKGFFQRLGFFSFPESKEKILIHTVSVGEFLAVLPLIRRVKNEFENVQVMVSVTTSTGYEVARRNLGDIPVVYFPLDLFWVVKVFFRKVRPGFIILVETELWPNFLTEARRRKIPVMVVNGRISNKSFKGYKIAKRMFKEVTKGIRKWCVQFEKDKWYLEELGIPQERIFITGALKVDSVVSRKKGVEERNKIKEVWCGKNSYLIIVGGSTHNGEEKILLEIYRKLKKEINELKLILVPRHIDRANSIINVSKSYGLNSTLRSQCFEVGFLEGCDVIVVDTFGELLDVYSVATVVFIGKSLCGRGGQNPLEPLIYEKVTICGPHMENFGAIVKCLLKGGGIVQVRDVKELEGWVTKLVKDEGLRIQIGKRGSEILYRLAGAIEESMRQIKTEVNL